MASPAVSFSGFLSLYDIDMLPNLSEGQQIPLAFVLKDNGFIFLNGYYTVRDGKKCFVGIYQKTEFTYSNCFAIAHIHNTEKEFTCDEVKGWSPLSNIGIGHDD